MNKKGITYLIRLLKVVLWTLVSISVMLILLAAVIQIPAVQTKIIKATTQSISDKTNTRVEIENVSISFPKSVVIKGVFLEDSQNDTLVYIGKTKINLSFYDLLQHNIHIDYFLMEKVNLHVYNNQADSLFNYNFLLVALSDTINSEVDTAQTTPWEFSVDDIQLKDISIKYDDVYDGFRLYSTWAELNLNFKELDLDAKVYDIDELLIEKLNTQVFVNGSESSDSKESESDVLPQIMVGNLEILQSQISFEDSVHQQLFSTDIQQFELNDANLDLHNQKLGLNRLLLSKSDIKLISSSDSIVENENKGGIANEEEPNNWTVEVQSVISDDNAFTYSLKNNSESRATFDPADIRLSHIHFEVSDILFAPKEWSASVKNMTIQDQNGFSVSNFKTDFYNDDGSINIKNFEFQTDASKVNAHVNIHFPSLQALADSMCFTGLDMVVREMTLANSDMLYFFPQLSSQPYFNDSGQTTSIYVKMAGDVNDIQVDSLVIQAGKYSRLQTQFSATGLPIIPDVTINNLKLDLETNRSDIRKMVGVYIPDSIRIPENVKLKGDWDGGMKAFRTAIKMNTSYGNASLSLNTDTNHVFNSQFSLLSFDLGALLRNDKMFGTTSLTAKLEGSGFGEDNIKSKLNATVKELYLNEYLFHNLTMNGNISPDSFEGTIDLEDENAAFNFEGKLDLSDQQPQGSFDFRLLGADLQKLHITDENIRVGFNLNANFKGASMGDLNGRTNISNIVVAKDDENYFADSLVVRVVNQSHQSSIQLASPFVDVEYTSKRNPMDMMAGLQTYLNKYFPFTDSTSTVEPDDFDFRIQLYNHPLFSEVLFPDLKTFNPGKIYGGYNKDLNQLKLYAMVNKLEYGSTEINEFVVDLKTSGDAIDYSISCGHVFNSQFDLNNFSIEGAILNQTIHTTIASFGEADKKNLYLQTSLKKDNDAYKLSVEPGGLYLMDNRWDVSEDNYLAFGDAGFKVHDLQMKNSERMLNIKSVNDLFNDDLSISIDHFLLQDISGIAERDSGMVSGLLHGDILFKRVNDSYGIVAKAQLQDLALMNHLIGNVSLKAENANTDKFTLELGLNGAGNQFKASGYMIPGQNSDLLNIHAQIQSLSMETIEAFSMGTIKNSSGNMTGNIELTGTTSIPVVNGDITFNNTILTPVALNHPIELKEESIHIQKDGVFFKSFTILDKMKHKAIVDGAVKMKDFDDIHFDLLVKARDFLLFNTSARDNNEFYGRMVIDSDIKVVGPLALPEINSRIKLKKGSRFTFAVPEEKLNTDKGEDVVEFEDDFDLNPILNRGSQSRQQKTALSGYSISSIIEIDKQASLKLLMDASSSDSLVVKGDAALSFSIDQSGKMSLTGAYNLNEGSYRVSMNSFVKRSFEIEKGSSILWSGNMMDAQISIDAVYAVKTSPLNLVADQMTDVNEIEKGEYKQRHKFWVILKLRGQILKPEISFEIKLPPENEGILGGAVNQKLILLNEDESALNKQVFALLVLGRFIRENPLDTEGGNTSEIARSTVSKFLSQQLNQWSSNLIQGVDLSFDIESFNDYQSGQEQGRTQMDIGVKKQLFDERLSVQVGGTVELEGEKARQNSASDITSDVTVEYKITKDGRYRLKGFRHNQYEGVIEGQLVETGIGVIFIRDFNKWEELFKGPEDNEKENSEE